MNDEVVRQQERVAGALPQERAVGSPRRRNKRGQGARLRQELVEAARHLLMTAQRESELSIRAVTRAAGTSPQSFYLQFATLDELLYAVYAIEFESLRETIVRAAAGADDPVAALTAVGRAYCGYGQEHPGRYRAMFGVRGQAHPQWEGLPGAQTFAVLQDAVSAALQYTASEAEPFLATTTLWAGLHGIVTLRADRPAFAWPELDDMIAFLVRRLVARVGRRPARRVPPG